MDSSLNGARVYADKMFVELLAVLTCAAWPCSWACERFDTDGGSCASPSPASLECRVISLYLSPMYHTSDAGCIVHHRQCTEHEGVKSRYRVDRQRGRFPRKLWDFSIPEQSQGDTPKPLLLRRRLGFRGSIDTGLCSGCVHRTWQITCWSCDESGSI